MAKNKQNKEINQRVKALPPEVRSYISKLPSEDKLRELEVVEQIVDRVQALPEEVRGWIWTLSPEAKLRELEIAEENLKRIGK